MPILCPPPCVWHTQLYSSSYGLVPASPSPSDEDLNMITVLLLMMYYYVPCLVRKLILCDVRLSEQSWKARYGKTVGIF